MPGLMTGRLLLVILFFGTMRVAAADQAATERTLGWVVQDLRKTLLSSPDLNRIASLSYPLVSAWKRGYRKQTAEILDQLSAYLLTIDVSKSRCGELADLYLIKGFLEQTGREIRKQTPWQDLLACDWGGRRFDLANALLFLCRYARQDPERYLPGALDYLQRGQRADGAFAEQNRRSNYYLSSHALLAVYYCNGDQRVIERGQAYLLHRLSPFVRQRFWDGLLESLIFLCWMDTEIPDYEHYIAIIGQQIEADGGLCFSGGRECNAHWHTMSLLLELQLMADTSGDLQDPCR